MNSLQPKMSSGGGQDYFWGLAKKTQVAWDTLKLKFQMGAHPHTMVSFPKNHANTKKIKRQNELEQKKLL